MRKLNRNTKKDRILAAVLAVGMVFLSAAAAAGISHVETIERGKIRYLS